MVILTRGDLLGRRCLAMKVLFNSQQRRRETKSILVLKWTFFVNYSVGSNYKNILLLKIQLKNVEKSLKSFVLFTSFDCYTNHATL